MSSKTVIHPGDKFNKLSAVRFVESRNGRHFWEFECECGNVITTRADRVKLGVTKSCGCLRKQSPSNTVDMVGQRFGKLKVIKRDGASNNGQAKWMCQCDCGNTITVLGPSLRGGKTKSCGCLLPVDQQVKDVHRHVKENLTIDNVNVPSLKRKVPSNNKTGVKGVYERQRNGKLKYEAYITLRKKQHYLGTFDNLKDAVAARKRAEKQIHQPYIKEMEEKQNERKRD